MEEVPGRKEDMMSVIDDIDKKYSRQRGVYEEFLVVWRDHLKQRKLMYSHLIEGVSILFRDCPDLLARFNAYLPPDFKIEVHPNVQEQDNLPRVNMEAGGETMGLASSTASPENLQTIAINSSESPAKPKTTSTESNTLTAEMEDKNIVDSLSLFDGRMNVQESGECIWSFLYEIQKYSSQPAVYGGIRAIIKEFSNWRSLHLTYVTRRIKILLRDSPDLLVRVNAFLPRDFRIEVHPNSQGQVSLPGVDMGERGETSGSASSMVPPGNHQTANNSSKSPPKP